MIEIRLSLALILILDASIDYRRVLIVGSGEKSRSVVVRGVVVGATRFPDTLMRQGFAWFV